MNGRETVKITLNKLDQLFANDFRRFWVPIASQPRSRPSNPAPPPLRAINICTLNIQAFQFEVGHFGPSKCPAQRGSVRIISGPPSQRTGVVTLRSVDRISLVMGHHFFGWGTDRSLPSPWNDGTVFSHISFCLKFYIAGYKLVSCQHSYDCSIEGKPEQGLF